MARRTAKKAPAAAGFLVDENVAAECSDYIASLGFRVGHIGRNEAHLITAPDKGTPDSLLKKTMQKIVFITRDKRLLRPGRLPGKHRGVFVVDASGGSCLDAVRRLFALTRWELDYFFVSRRFLVSPERIYEVEPDGSLSNRYW